MNLETIYNEEDLFPREITSYDKRDYGLLFYNEENKNSYDSNHAILFRKKVSNLQEALKDIILFYTKKGIRPIIYESVSEEGYFEEIKTELLDNDFECRTELQKYMILSEKSIIEPNSEVIIKKVSEWNDEYGKEIFEKAGEPWEINVVKNALRNKNTLFFVAFYKGIPVGMTRCHVTNGICRVDYVLVSKEYRNIGVARTLINSFVEYCIINQIENCYLWPDGDTAEKIYYEAGFRYTVTKQAGRAIYKRY
ncbi:MAG: GNAT family N-acetyltransferase [Clostridiales bacterium]|nr:GNAT family N-acetyltransferase [Clostridiales bacterium]